MLVVMRLGETPVPIPNTMVKPQTADGTALETVWESRWPPATKKKNIIRDMRFEENFRFHMTDKNQSEVSTLHLAARLLGRVQARKPINSKPSYESELSTPFLIDCVVYLENRI